MPSNAVIFLWDVTWRPVKSFFSFKWLKGTEKWLNSTKNIAGIFLLLTVLSLVVAFLMKLGVILTGIFSRFGDIRLTFIFLGAYILFSLMKHYQSGEYKGNWRKAHNVVTNPGEALQIQSDKEKEEFEHSLKSSQKDI